MHEPDWQRQKALKMDTREQMTYFPGSDPSISIRQSRNAPIGIDRKEFLPFDLINFDQLIWEVQLFQDNGDLPRIWTLKRCFSITLPYSDW